MLPQIVLGLTLCVASSLSLVNYGPEDENPLSIFQDSRSYRQVAGFEAAQLQAMTTETPNPDKCKGVFNKLWKKDCTLFDIFRTKTTPRPTPPPTVAPPDDASKGEVFNLGAFIIALFVSLIIALTGAFACWCFRTFLKRGTSPLTRRSDTLDSSPSTTIADDSGMAMESLVRQTPPTSGYLRTASLPSYASATSHSHSKPAVPLQEEPPPSYASLFTPPLPENGVSKS